MSVIFLFPSSFEHCNEEDQNVGQVQYEVSVSLHEFMIH